MKAQFFLTRNGILAANNESIVFLTNSGEFVRNCSVHEFDYLTKEVGLVEITRTSGSTFPLFEIPKPTKWHFITTIEIVNDESNFRWKTCNNGGDYRYTTYRDFFVRNMNGKWQFAYIDWFSTSADFGYDNISGQFQTDLVSLYLEDCETEHYYRIWGRNGEDEFQVIEKLATMTSIEEMLATEFEYIPSRYDEDGKGYTQPALSDEKRAEIQATLVGLGWTPKHPRGSRRSSNGGRRK